MNVATPITSAAIDDAGDQARSIVDGVTDSGETVVAKAETIALSARDALAEMRRIVDAFAAATGERAGEAVAAVTATSTETAERIGALVDDARLLGKEGLDTMAEKVSERPFTALAVAAGVGLALGLLTRSDTRR